MFFTSAAFLHPSPRDNSSSGGNSSDGNSSGGVNSSGLGSNKVIVTSLEDQLS